jgi:hypothetical protein
MSTFGLRRSPVWIAFYDEEIAGVLRGLLIRLDDRLPAKDVTLIVEFIDANEDGLALGQIADVLSEDEQPLAAGERADMVKLVDRMQLGDRVPRALSFCPER